MFSTASNPSELNRAARRAAERTGGDTGPRLLVAVPEACERLQVGRSTIYALMTSGELPSVKVHRRRLIPAAALEAFVEGLGA